MGAKDKGKETTIRTSQQAAMDSNRSGMEKCSFACHLFLYPIGLGYLLWIVIPKEILETTLGVTYYPRKEYAENIPVSMLFLFLAAPFLYAAFNSFTVPTVDSMETIQDMYTQKPTKPMSLTTQFGQPPESTLPEICDIDPATLMWYPIE